MPEMLQYCGRVFPVFKRADKTCAADGAVRRMHNAVHLGNVRCDGSAHGGCQAACLMHWKEAWLERVDDGTLPDAGGERAQLEVDEQAYLGATLLPATQDGGEIAEADPTYRCQATEIPDASAPLRVRQVDQYLRDLRNWGILKIVRGLAVAALDAYQRFTREHLPRLLLVHGGRPYPFISGQLERGKTPTAHLDLSPGDLVRVKSKGEIVKTLDRANRNRGLSFDSEMVRYCGRTARVRGRVTRLVDEKTGKMIRLETDCIILDGVVCGGDYHLFCTRSIYPYWREIWLEKLKAAEPGQSPGRPGCVGRGLACLDADRDQ